MRVLRGLVEHDRFVPALLFVGPPSCGKNLAARALAWTANCDTRSACGVCAPCRANAHGEGLREINLADIFADDRIKVKVAALKEFLSDQAMAHSLPHRLCVIDRAELLNDAMQGAILKAIEEPPPRVTFVLVTESASVLAATIRSRSMIVRFRALGASDLAMILAEQGDAIAASASPALLAAAEGSVERARRLIAAYGDIDELVAAFMKPPGRGTKRADVLDRLALSLPAVAVARPAWRDALLALDAGIAANAHIGLSYAVFLAAVERLRPEQSRPR